MSLMAEIQKELKAPKGQTNNFGKYQYRSCEDIVEAVKPILTAKGLHLNLSDEMVNIGDRYYIKATASIIEQGAYNDEKTASYGDRVIGSATAFAREPENKKGMDESQITGTASSYARKYALNGLLAIDDSKDADTDEHAKQVNDGKLPTYNDFAKHRATMEERVEKGEDPKAILETLRQKYTVTKKIEDQILDIGKVQY